MITPSGYSKVGSLNLAINALVGSPATGFTPSGAANSLGITALGGGNFYYSVNGGASFLELLIGASIVIPWNGTLEYYTDSSYGPGFVEFDFLVQGQAPPHGVHAVQTPYSAPFLVKGSPAKLNSFYAESRNASLPVYVQFYNETALSGGVPTGAPFEEYQLPGAAAATTPTSLKMGLEVFGNFGETYGNGIIAALSTTAGSYVAPTTATQYAFVVDAT